MFRQQISLSRSYLHRVLSGLRCVIFNFFLSECPQNSVTCNARSLFNRTDDIYCVPYGAVVCDGINDCPLGEDEVASLCTFDSESCGGSVEVRVGEARYITSPNFPFAYGTNVECSWELVAPADFYIELTFVLFDTEECCDCIEVTQVSLCWVQKCPNVPKCPRTK